MSNFNWKKTEDVWALVDNKRHETTCFGFVVITREGKFLAFLNTYIFDDKRPKTFDRLKEAIKYVEQLVGEEEGHYEEILATKEVERQSRNENKALNEFLREIEYDES